MGIQRAGYPLSCIARYRETISAIPPYPDLLFLAVLEKEGKTPQKQQGFVLASETLKSLEKKQKTLKKARVSLKRKK